MNIRKIDGFLQILFFFYYPNPNGSKRITRLKLGLSHLYERRFKYSFQDSINLLRKCGKDTKSATLYLSPASCFYENVPTFEHFKKHWL